MRGRRLDGGAAALRVAASLGLAVVVCACSAEEDSSGTRVAAGSGAIGAAASGAPGIAGAAGTTPTGAASGTAAGDSATAGVSGGSAGAAGAPSGGGESGRGAPCDQVGTTRLCCGTGVQTCLGEQEFPAWGPCEDGSGSEIVCDSCAENEFGPGCADAGIDAGPPPSLDAGPPPVLDAGAPPPPNECGPGTECKPGSIRYCDVPGMEWSVSTCDSSGHWGACLATTVPAGAIGCAQNDYAPELCCPVLHLCCQNDNGPFVDFGSGACAEIGCP